jgi:hypothetical protein
MEWILRGSGSQYDLISRAGVLTGLMLLFTTVVALLFNKTKREQVLADLAKPFECAPTSNPGRRPYVQPRLRRLMQGHTWLQHTGQDNVHANRRQIWFHQHEETVTLTSGRLKG